MLTIWGRLNSHNVKKVAWFAEELALPYVRHDVGGQFGMSDAYLALNPNALVPTIEDDGFILWESNAILRYLAARHGGKSWWPEDPVQRAQADRWMDWQFDYADAQRGAFLHLIRRPLAERDPAVIAASAAACAAKMQILDHALAQTPWLSGAEFGMADIPMGTYAHSWFTLDIARPSVPHVEAWYARLTERPAFAAQVMIPLT
ncbi:glutathione S-transferase [Sphingomonas sp. BE270]|jgi:glutathione S-transferase|nr:MULTISPECIES: glutathione S-transferase family protein [unclassified Sphingomonas]MDR6849218.1 glutathione S-transferase [Sphingomonas sp. BE137]MDR7259779.1 glutathione S-transferase [Sphingomonas sp. BE270]RUN77237.1 glutathione S-transferase family protein [Sphingomonas sp. TF3]